jgi:S1-C subfamily serine protease
MIISRGMIVLGLLLTAAAQPAPSPTPLLDIRVAPPPFSGAHTHDANFGLSFTGSMAGAIIESVAPGSKADGAGLKPGEMIAAVNGKSVKGLSARTITELIGANPVGVTLKIVGIGDVVLTNGP